MRLHPDVKWIVLVGLCGTAIGCAGPTPTPVPTPPPPRPVPSATQTSARPAPRPLPSASATPTLVFTPTPAVTETPSNAAILTRLAHTPAPVVLNQALPNATGLVPGQTTEAQALAALGEPVRRSEWKKIHRWSYQLTSASELSALSFADGILRELDFRPKG